MGEKGTVSAREPLEHWGREAAIPSCRGLTWERQVKALKRSKNTKQVTGALSTGVPEPAGPQKGDPWKDPPAYRGEKTVSSDWMAIGKRVKSEHSLTPHTEINSKWIKDVNVRLDTVKIREENRKNT